MKGRFLPILLIVIAAAGLFANALRDDFVWDDRALVVEDYHIRSPRFFAEIFTRDFFSHSDDELKYGYYRPVITMSYMLDIALWGLRPAGFHATNILLHAACAVLVYLLALRLLKPTPPCGHPSGGGATPPMGGVAGGRGGLIALIAGLLFAAHPVHTESVTWIAGRTDVICALFFLGSLYLHILDRSPATRVLAILFFTLATLSKEMALTLPGVVFLYEFGNDRKFRPALMRALPYAAVVAMYLVWRSAIVRVEYTPGPAADLFTLALSAVKTFWLYVLKLVWPLPLNAYIQNPYINDLLAPSIVASLLLSALVAGALWKLRGMAFFIPASFVMMFLPLCNVLRISSPMDMGFMMAERFLYLPSAFFSIGAAWLLVRISRRPWTAGVLCASILAFWGSAVVARNTDWRNDETFFTRCLVQSPDAPLLHACLAGTYTREGKHADAVRHLQQAQMLIRYQTQSEAAAVRNNLAAAYIAAGEYDKALPILQDLMKGKKINALYEYNLGRCYLHTGDPRTARELFRAALTRRPNFVDAIVGIAESCEAEDRFPDAAEAYRLALSLFPKSPELHLALGVALKKNGEIDAAMREFGTALAMNPQLAAARGNLGVAYALRGDYTAARTNLEAALAMNPALRDAQNALGMCYAMQKDIPAARAKFAEILAADSNNTEALLNEGILFHQEGNVDAARERFARVLQIEPQHKRAKSFLKQINEERKTDGT